MLFAISVAAPKTIASRGQQRGSWHRNKFIKIEFLVIAALCLISPAGAQNSAQVDAQTVLEKNCVACHGSTRMSGLDVRDRAAILKGGTRGPAIVPGDAEQSLLYKAVARTGELKMPPGKTGLSPTQIDAIRSWINAGASWNARVFAATEPSWWSFKRVKKPVIPSSAKVRTNPQSNRCVHFFPSRRKTTHSCSPRPIK